MKTEDCTEEETVLAVTTRAQKKKADTEDENLDAEAEAALKEVTQAKCPDLLEQSPEEEAAEQSPSSRMPRLV